jgi:outer membrane lipoprotein-sorting protein
MQRKKIAIIVAAVVVVAALTAGLAVARAQSGSDLPPLTPAELLAKVAESAPKTTTVSGDVTWTNDLLGPIGMLLAPAGGSMGGSPGGFGFASLLQSGSGRMWLDGNKVRLESQSSQGDTALVSDGAGLWVYSSQAATATEYTLPVKPGTEAAAADGGPAAGVDLPAKIQEFMTELAPDATLAVDQVKVAGRAAYQLTMTPTASNTVVGSAQVAIDGATFVPLQVQVFAKADTKPVLSAGFTRVSYDPVAANVFEFTPPAGAKVEHSTLALPEGMIAGMHPGAQKGATAGKEPATLTLAEAQTQAGFTLLTPAGDGPALKGAYVMPAGEVAASGSPALGSLPALAGGAPVVVLQYGEGFGSVFLVETTISAADLSKVTAELAKVPVLGTTTPVGPHAVYQLGTRLGSAMVFAENGTVVLAAGAVSQADLADLVAGIK